MTQRRVLFACDLDSQVFGAAPLALAFEARGWKAVFAIHAASELSSAARDKLDSRFEVLDARLGALAVSEQAFGFGAIGVFATGSRIARFRYDLALAARVFGGKRPALFCGFNGLVFEKFEEGVAWRLGYDVLCLNGPRDRDAFFDFVGPTPFAAQPIAVVGLSRRGGAAAPAAKPASTAGIQKTFLFAEQVLAPSDPEHRAALVATLARLAAASPGWRIVIKARVRPQERTFHDQVAHVETLVAGLTRRPANLTLSYAPLDELLGEADLFGTVSSTALFDALDHGVPCCVAADFGVRNAYGTHVLFGSGLAVVLSDCATLDDLPRRTPDPVWLDRIGYGPAHSAKELIDRLERFDHHSPFQLQAQSLETSTMLRGRIPPVGTEAIAAGRAEVEAALGQDDSAAARAALLRLGGTLERSDAQHSLDSAWRRHEGPLAAFARRRKMYWFYKKLRRALFGVAPP